MEKSRICSNCEYYVEGDYEADWCCLNGDIIDSMFMEQGSISVDDWFHDSKNLFQGREVFKKRMEV